MPLCQSSEVGMGRFGTHGNADTCALLCNQAVPLYCTSGQLWSQVHLRPHDKPVIMTLLTLLDPNVRGPKAG